jgi:hypothetical protein
MSSTPEQISAGTVTGLKEMERGWLRFATQREYDEFRKEHHGVSGHKMGQTKSVPLPDFDFTDNDLIIVWSARTVNILEVKELSVKEIVIHEDEPEHAEAICQMVFAGYYLMFQTSHDNPTTVRWVD